MFNEQKEELYNGKKLPVWQSPKYEQSKAKVLEMIKAHDGILSEADFWILMNTNKDKSKMIYTGLIISHNGCLKLNDTLPEEMRFKPECVTCDKEGYNNSLVYTYSCSEQGIYEVGEYSPANSKQSYPYAMAYKRLFDRVVLKNTRLAYSGIYSEVEADEFKEVQDTPNASAAEPSVLASEAERKAFSDLCIMANVNPEKILKEVGWKGEKLTRELQGKAMDYLKNTLKAG